MYLQILKNIMISRGLSQSDIASLACVSRAAVTKWFRQGKEKGWINVEAQTIFRLAQSLKIPPENFLKERKDISIYQTEFLWDSLYPNMESFLKAAVEGRCDALARLVQVLGFHRAKAVAGRKAITSFQKYKRHIQPQRRKNLEAVWNLYAA